MHFNYLICNLHNALLPHNTDPGRKMGGKCKLVPCESGLKSQVTRTVIDAPVMKEIIYSS